MNNVECLRRSWRTRHATFYMGARSIRVFLQETNEEIRPTLGHTFAVPPKRLQLPMQAKHRPFFSPYRVSANNDFVPLT
jgi:hypothetical protein